jgi:hypothetical protein
VKLMEAGVLGRRRAGPQASPECSASTSTWSSAVADPPPPTAPAVYQWRFSDADPGTWSIDNGSTGPSPARRPNPTVTFESSWADWVLATRPAPVREIDDARQVRPRGKIRSSCCGMPRVFAG